MKNFEWPAWIQTKMAAHLTSFIADQFGEQFTSNGLAVPKQNV
jgi:hypothetical protein